MIRIARALVLQWFYNGFTVVGPVRGFLHSRRLWFYSGFTLVLQWSDPCGKFYTAPALVLQWFYNGFTMVLQWLYTGVALRAPCLRLARIRAACRKHDPRPADEHLRAPKGRILNSI